MKCIAIDDEPRALELISGYIEKTPFLEFVAGFTNPFTAMNFLLKNPIDLVFIDINMPELSGIELLKALPVLPKIIFTTAYSEYGAESYEFNAVDYLLKPVKYDRFLKGVNKLIDFSSPKKEETNMYNSSEPHSQSVLIKSGSKTFKIATDDILYIEAAGNYMLFYTLKGKIMTLLPMNEILKLLPSNKFKRIHKSYIISLKHIEIIEKAVVIINKTRVPIGITYREHFSNMIKND
ncbi:LytTR family DNA-binding domain-containing protein [Flavobacterium sp. LB2P84]|uniref:LytTR family DNA-binding domain-containing protein n=1 Tax=Flavobacterium yafengii TaxID=3041253 RepID=A0AAW6TNM7_9FLAO|nr:LytTR family DNA-binding domain-containing protein [Flavobacterium yafengii]MDI5950354.1 LytTR family DNA-binding domain-containing protein [Flavobacterium yafengii]MDI6033739.1 LytTR family DNA-binding domain-containing protein [Flavobacterium yafengii]